MLEFHSGSTRAVDPERAVAECLEAALGPGSSDCDLIVLYATVGHRFKELLAAARRLAPRARIVGCTGAGVIGREGPTESMKALGIMAVKGPGSELAVAAVERITKPGSYEAGARIAEELKSGNPGVRLVLFHPSALNGSPAAALEGIESVFGPDVSVFGGLSIDNIRFVSDFQFLDDRILEGGAVAVGFADPSIEIGTEANHGLVAIGDPLVVTRSEGNHVFELDGQLAWKSYTEHLGLPENAAIIELALAPPAAELPPELREEYGSPYIVRGYTGMFAGDGSIFLTESCPVGTRLWLTKRDEKGIFDGLDRMVAGIARRLDGRRPLAVFHADCSARGRMLFNRFLKEEIVSRMQVPLGEGVPWLGIYGGGEYARLGGRNRIHAYTTALCVLVRRDEPVAPTR